MHKWYPQPSFSNKVKESSFRERKLNTNFFFSNFSGAPGISRQNPGISRTKSLISLASRDVSNFLAPTRSRGRPLPHWKISGPKSLGLGSFFLPDPSLCKAKMAELQPATCKILLNSLFSTPQCKYLKSRCTKHELRIFGLMDAQPYHVNVAQPPVEKCPE